MHYMEFIFEYDDPTGAENKAGTSPCAARGYWILVVLYQQHDKERREDKLEAYLLGTCSLGIVRGDYISV